MSDKNQWWAEAYNQMQKLGYDYHYIDFESAQKEIDFMKEVLNLKKGDTILDLGCGNGRHAILLSESGYRVTGIDYSKELLRMAEQEAKNRKLDIDFRHEDMLSLDEDLKYDAIIIMDGSFGIFSDKENEEVIKRVAKALKLGGKLLLQVYNPYYMAINQSRNAEIEGDSTFIRDTSFDIYQGTVVDKIICLDNLTGKHQRISTRYYRAYTIPELEKITNSYGLDNLQIYGHDDDFYPNTEKSFEVEEDAVVYLVVVNVNGTATG